MGNRTGMLTGATGYVGGLVLERLLDEGWSMRVLVRDASKLEASVRQRVEVVEGDAESDEDLARAMAGAKVAWFLMHSMGGDGDFAKTELSIAEAFAKAAAGSGVERIVYLGGLHPGEEDLSEHLASRVAVGEVLMGSGVPTAAIHAGVVMGAGSASFDMLRTLTERLPAAGGPAWLRNQIQPIDAADVVHYLVAAADLPAEVNRTFDVGGPDRLSYAEMMQRYARVRGLGPRPVASPPVPTRCGIAACASRAGSRRQRPSARYGPCRTPTSPSSPPCTWPTVWRVSRTMTSNLTPQHWPPTWP